MLKTSNQLKLKSNNISFIVFFITSVLSFALYSCEGQSESDDENSLDGKYGYVDLGLPSGTLWATKNVGARAVDDCGYYFAWAETNAYDAGKKSFTWDTYKYCNGSGTTLVKYNTKDNYGMVDGVVELSAEDDAASVNWGKEWSIPTREQQDELRTKCRWEWVSNKKKSGYKITGINGNSIFMPAAGFCYKNTICKVGDYGRYWSRTLNTRCPDYAYSIHFDSDSVCWGDISRYYGRTIRPVRSKK
jgi:hypothetical protein